MVSSPCQQHMGFLSSNCLFTVKKTDQELRQKEGIPLQVALTEKQKHMSKKKYQIFVLSVLLMAVNIIAFLF